MAGEQFPMFFDFFLLARRLNREKFSRAAIAHQWLRKWTARVLAMGIRQHRVL